MALLRALLAALLIAGCSQDEALGHADFNLRDCASCGAPARHYQVQAFFDAQVSRYAPNGFYAYFELERPDGTRGVLELDVPTNVALSSEDASYRELRAGRVVFEAESVQGSVQLPRSLMAADAVRCGCEDALFELTFRSASAARELSYGHLGRSRAVCGARPVARTDPGLAVQVLDCSAAPPAPPVSSAPAAPSVSTARAQPVAANTGASHSCAYASCDRDYTPVEAGCGGGYYGGSGYDDSGCGSSSGDGCGDADSGSASNDGCGDSGSSSASNDGCSDSGEPKSHGCEGDTSDSPSSCQVARPAHGALRSFMGTGLPLTLVCLWQSLRAARERRRSQRLTR